jgi:Ca2+-binding RTX toxin-like protein
VDLHWTFDLVQVPENWEPTVFLNEGDGTFARLSERAPGTLVDAVVPRGSLNWARFLDADGDGRTDLLFLESEQPGDTLMTRFGLLRRTESVLEYPDTDDTITGTPFPDTIRAGGGDDRIEAGLGGDTIRGGPGTDTAVFPGTRSEYTVAGGTTSATVTGRGVTDRLEGVEHLRFSDTREPLPAGSVE